MRLLSLLVLATTILSCTTNDQEQKINNLFRILENLEYSYEYDSLEVLCDSLLSSTNEFQKNLKEYIEYRKVRAIIHKGDSTDLYQLIDKNVYSRVSKNLLSYYQWSPIESIDPKHYLEVNSHIATSLQKENILNNVLYFKHRTEDYQSAYNQLNPLINSSFEISSLLDFHLIIQYADILRYREDYLLSYLYLLKAKSFREENEHYNSPVLQGLLKAYFSKTVLSDLQDKRAIPIMKSARNDLLGNKYLTNEVSNLEVNIGKVYSFLQEDSLALFWLNKSILSANDLTFKKYAKSALLNVKTKDNPKSALTQLNSQLANIDVKIIGTRKHSRIHQNIGDAYYRIENMDSAVVHYLHSIKMMNPKITSSGPPELKNFTDLYETLYTLHKQISSLKKSSKKDQVLKYYSLLDSLIIQNQHTDDISTLHFAEYYHEFIEGYLNELYLKNNYKDISTAHHLISSGKNQLSEKYLNEDRDFVKSKNTYKLLNSILLKSNDFNKFDWNNFTTSKENLNTLIEELEIQLESNKSRSISKISSIRNSLPDKTAMIEFYFGEEYLYSLWHDKDTSILSRTSSIGLRNTIVEYRNHLILNDTLILANKGNAIFLKLFKEQLIREIDHLVVIPDGTLNLIPLRHINTTKNSYKPLHELFTLTYKFESKPILSKVKLHDSDSTTVLAINYSDEETINNSVGDEAFTELPFTKLEINNLEKKFSKAKFIRLSGYEATKQNFFKHVEKADLIYIATHAASSQTNRLDNYIVLRAEDGLADKLFGYELLSAKIKAQEVVLSACETGTGSYQKGDGVMSLGKYFYMRGAKELKTTLWPINDLNNSNSSIIIN